MPPPADLYHYEFIFDPHSRKQMAMEASAPKVPYEPGVPTPKPRWIVRDKNGYAPGINILRRPGSVPLLVPPRIITGLQFKQYRKIALLNGVRGTPGQIYTSSIYYLEGYTESAFAVSVRDAPATIDISSEVAREMRLPSISQVRLCPRARRRRWASPSTSRSRRSSSSGSIDDERFPEFERRLDAAFRKAGIRYTMHWSKNSGHRPGQARLHVRRGEDRELEGGEAGRLRRRRDADEDVRDRRDGASGAGLTGAAVGRQTPSKTIVTSFTQLRSDTTVAPLPAVFVRPGRK